jgi:hypothetical protein
MFTTEKVTPIGDPVPDNDCVLGLGSTGCDVTFTLNFTLTVDFYLCDDTAAPADVTAAGCPADSTTFLDSQSQPGSQKVTHHFSTWDITKAIDEGVIQSLWDGITADFVNCAHGNISSCAWAATWFVPQSKILDAVKLVGKLNDALRAGIGIEDALQAVEAIGLDAKAMAELKSEVQATEDALTGCVINSFPRSTQVLLADGTHKAIGAIRIGDRLLATDPATGRSQAEPVTATFAHDTDTLLDIRLSGGSTLSTTTGHRVYAANRGWILAADLRPGDLLQAADGSSSAVTAVSTRAGLAPQQVYDLTVQGLHTFYIRSTGTDSRDLLVHNCNNLADDELQYPDLAHTLKDHVTDAATAIAKAKAEQAAGRGDVTSVFVDAQTAQQVVDYAIASDAEKNAKRLANWLSRSKKNPTELYTIAGTFGAKNSIGTIYKADESFRAAGNGYTVVLKRMPGHPRGYIVYTAYPTA